METIIFEKNKEKYKGLFWKGIANNKEVAVVYFHGLNGKAKMVHPLIKNLNEFDFYSFEQRGHTDSFQKASTKVKKHINDIKSIVAILKEKYKKIYLCGESMGALYISLYGYKFNDVDAVFAWSIPFQPKNIMIEKNGTKLLIYSRVFITFLFGINFKYSAKIDYPKLTNSKLLIKLHEFDIQVKGSSSEEISIWKASLKAKHLFLKKKPKTNIYYWQGENDVMSNNKLLNKIKDKNFIFAQEIPNSKHILMYEKNFNLVVEKIKSVISNKD